MNQPTHLSARDQILRMRADADRLASVDTQHAPAPHPLQRAHSLVILREHNLTRRIRLRRLQPGERLHNGDLWLDPSTDSMRPLPVRWWRAFVGRIGADSVEHYRIE